MTDAVLDRLSRLWTDMGEEIRELRESATDQSPIPEPSVSWCESHKSLKRKRTVCCSSEEILKRDRWICDWVQYQREQDDRAAIPWSRDSGVPRP